MSLLGRLLILAADWYWCGKGRRIGFGLFGLDTSRIATPAGLGGVRALNWSDNNDAI